MALMQEQKLNKLVENFATVFGVGRWPRWPGTWGTVVTVPLAILLSQLDLMTAATIVFLIILLAIVVSHFYEKTHEHDASEVVIDEVAGYLVACLGVQGWWFLVAFVLFRIFDILKPWPISHFDQKVPGGFGVVMDDVVAGMATNAMIHFLFLGVFREQIDRMFG